MSIQVTKNAKTNTLTIVMPLASKGTLSASGKSEIVATTRGNQPIVLDGKVVSIGVNVYSKV